jgi:hypothetical protein
MGLSKRSEIKDKLTAGGYIKGLFQGLQYENLLKSADDLTDTDYWLTVDITPTDRGDGVFRITKDVGAGYKSIYHGLVNWVPTWAAEISFICEVRAGTLDKIGLSITGSCDDTVSNADRLDEVEIIHGSGSTAWVGGHASISGLDSSWTKVRVTGNVKNWLSALALYIYPDHEQSNTGYLEMRNLQLILGDQPDEKPRPPTDLAEADYAMMAYRPHWRPFPDGSGRMNITDGTLSSQMLANAGFETAGGGGADIWGTWIETASDGALANETGIKHAGSDSAKITAGAATDTRIEQQAITVVPGVPYTLTFYTYGDGSNAGRYRVWDDSNAANIIGVTAVASAAASWTRTTAHFIAPSGCTTIFITFYCPATDGGLFYVDSTNLRAQQTSGLVTIGKAFGVDLALAESTEHVVGADQEFWFTTDVVTAETGDMKARYTDTNNCILIYISGIQCSVGYKDGGDLTWVDQNHTALQGGVHYRHRVVINGTGADSRVRWYIDDKLVSDNTDAGFDTGGTSVKCEGAGHQLNRLVVESYPKRDDNIIVHGGLSKTQWSDPSVNLTDPDGNAFPASLGAAIVADVAVTPLTSKAAIIGWHTSLASEAASSPRWYFTGSATLYAEDYQFAYDGSAIGLLLLNRANLRGSHFFTHELGKRWKRKRVTDTVYPWGATGYPRIQNHSKAIVISLFALLDLGPQSVPDYSATVYEVNDADGSYHDLHDGECVLEFDLDFGTPDNFSAHYRANSDASQTWKLYISPTGQPQIAKDVGGKDVGTAGDVSAGNHSFKIYNGIDRITVEMDGRVLLQYTGSDVDDYCDSDHGNILFQEGTCPATNVKVYPFKNEHGLAVDDENIELSKKIVPANGDVLDVESSFRIEVSANRTDDAYIEWGKYTVPALRGAETSLVRYRRIIFGSTGTIAIQEDAGFGDTQVAIKTSAYNANEVLNIKVGGEDDANLTIAGVDDLTDVKFTQRDGRHNNKLRFVSGAPAIDFVKIHPWPHRQKVLERDFVEVTDTKTNPASGTGWSRSTSGLHLNSTFTFEATKYVALYQGVNDYLACYAMDSPAGRLSVREVVGGTPTEIIGVAGVFSDGVGAEVDLIHDENGNISVFVDKVLKGTAQSSLYLGLNAGSVAHNLVTNDIVLTAYPYPAWPHPELYARRMINRWIPQPIA